MDDDPLSDANLARATRADEPPERHRWHSDGWPSDATLGVGPAMTVRPEGLPDSVAARIREIEDAYPEADVVLVGGLAAEVDP